MSFSGKYTPLQLNVLSSLKGNTTTGEPSGLKLNEAVKNYQGKWDGTTYTMGSLVTDTGLSNLQSAIVKLYTRIVGGDTTIQTAYRALLKAGGDCRVLTNSKPDSFIPTYAGHGSWKSGTMVEDTYPPRNYPVTGTYSSVYATKSSYGYVTSWPGSNTWQRGVDTFKAADPNSLASDEYFSDGFLACVAKQAHYEMWEEHFNQYQLIAKTINQAYAFKSAENKNISSLISSKTFMSGTYSNVNDLCSADISGVSLAFAAFGGDLINLGRALDLTNINKFGLPSNLLNTLDKNNVTTATKTVEMALLLAGLSTQEIIEIKTPGYQPTKIQEASIYKAFTYVIDGDGGSDLSDVLAKLNCTTEGLASLADLLDPKKIFPTSYKTLTVPKYNIDRNITNSGKIYYLIYDNGGINTTQLQQLAQYFTVDLEGILSAELIMACGALSMSLQQVKNIRSMDIERFAPVVANLEVPNNGMPLLNQTNGIAVDPKLMDAAQQRSALGSGNGGQYRMCDFFGAACGFPYSTWYEQIQRLVPSIMSSTLTGYYSALDAQAATIDSATLTTMVAQIETEVTRIANANRVKADELNFYWTQIGRQLTVEQRAVALAYKNAEELSTGSSASDVENLMTQLETYALDSGVGQTATVLSGLADTSTVGGQSLVAALREARNAKRIQLAGGELNNNVQNYIDPCAASATATVVGGKITKVVVTNPSNGYTQAQLPSILVYPVNVKKQAVLVPVLAGGGIASVRIVDGGEGYDQDTIHVEIEEPPQCQYSAPAQQTYNDTPYSQLISPELVAPSDAIMTADEAIQSVITCNCDCWLE